MSEHNAFPGGDTRFDLVWHLRRSNVPARSAEMREPTFASSAPEYPDCPRHICSRKPERKSSSSTTAPSGGGESGRTTAHLANAMDDWIYVLEHVHGDEARVSLCRAMARPSNRSSKSCAPKRSTAISSASTDFFSAATMASTCSTPSCAAHRVGWTSVVAARSMPHVDYNFRPVPSLSESGSVPSLEVSRRLGGRDRAPRWTYLL